MNIYRDIGKVLLKLDDNYYEKGIKKISVSLNGIRSEKIPHMSRRVIIPQMRTEAIDWLGVLATEEEIRNNNLGRSNCIVNKWDTLQFYLKVISRMPGQASNTQYVVCYSNRLDNEAIVDNGAYDEDVRIDDYVKQLKNYFFRFNYEENQAGYFVAKNIDAINLSEDYYPGKGFTTIPMIVSKHPVYPNDRVYDNFEELENALKNDEYVSKLNKYNTSGLDNIPYLIFHNTETLEYRIIGNFTGFDYDVTRGIRYDCFDISQYERNWKVAAFAVDSMGNQFFGERDDTK